MEKLKSGKVQGVQDDIDALFQLPLTEFTAARNALAARVADLADLADLDRRAEVPVPSCPSP